MTNEKKDSELSATESREMFDEITALMGGIAKAFALTESDTITAVEKGEVVMSFETDTNGNRFVLAHYNGQSARIYDGAVKSETAVSH